MGEARVLGAGAGDHVQDTLPDLVEAIRAGLAAALEQRLELRWRHAEHDVDEVLLVDPAEHAVTWLQLHDGAYEPIERSGLIDLGATELAQRIDWP